MAQALLDLLEGRLAEVEAEREQISFELHRLEARATELSEEAQHLRALIEIHLAAPAKPGTSKPAPAEEPARWLGVAIEVLTKEGRPLHYRDLYKRMKALGGPAFGGKNPVATFLSALSREAARPEAQLVRLGAGSYGLPGQALEASA